MKPNRNKLLLVSSLAGFALTSADAATFNWARGLAGSFAWNNSTGVTAGETAPSGVINGNWGGAAGVAGTVPGVNFPGVAGDIANLNNNTSATQTINFDQNVIVGQVLFGNGASANTRTLASGGAGSFVLTMNNSAANSSISQTSTSIGNVTAAVAIGGNGVLALSNSNATGQLNINGGITSALTSGTQTLSKTGAQTVNVNSIIGNGSSGGTVVVDVTAGTLNLTGANTYTGTTTITAGALVLGGTTGALSTSSAITNNGTFAINRTNTVVQGTDFSSSGITGTGGLNAIGTGLNLTLNTANSYAGATTIGTGANNSVLRATASGALGSGNIVLDQTGNASTARLELEGGITLSNPILFTARNNASSGIRNISGNNSLSGAITLGTGGATYTIESAAGMLTVSGDITPPNSATRTVVITGDGDGGLSGNLNLVSGNTLALSKGGTGTWTVSSTGNTYTGATTVTDGKLIVDGNISTSVSTVSGAGTLGGSGVVGNLIAQSGGTVAPGNSIESLGAGNVSFDSGSTFAYELNTATLNGDLLDSSGTLNVTSGAILTLTELASATRSMGDKLTLLSYTGAWNNGLFTYLGNNLADDSQFTLGSNVWQFNYNDLSGGSNFTSDQSGATGFVTMTVVPEPGAAVLGSLGMLALLRRRR